MGIIKKDIKNELKAKYKKLDLIGLLNDSNDLIEKNIDSLNCSTTAQPFEVAKLINKKYKENVLELETFIESQVNELIPEEMVNLINETLKEQQRKIFIEDQIKLLKYQILTARNNSTNGEINTVKLDMEVEEKEDELRDCRKKFLGLYNKAIESSLVSLDLNEIFKQLNVIRIEEVKQLEKDINLLKAKAKAMRLLNTNILEISKEIIDKRFKLPIIADTIIDSSRQQVPVIKSIVK